ncbi:MAG TPA: MFS transporter [Ramlibacter sp.]|nr:MFS transporter [Ramlibacter sp.]
MLAGMPSPGPLPSSPSTGRWTLAAAILGSSMVFVDGTVVNVALPAIQDQLHADAAQAQWVIESYALFLASLLLLGGSLGDRFGRRRVFLWGVAIFTIAALGCALARTIHQLIAARALQGIGGALLVPGSLALISATFPQEERGRAIGTWSGASGVAAAIGPVVGGALIDYSSWIWAFLVNLPLGVMLFAFTPWKVPESHGEAARSRLDTWGATLATVGLAGLVFALIEAPVRGWGSPLVLGAAAVGAAALAGFAIAERRIEAPMLDFALFRNRDFTGANLLTLALYAALGGGLYFLPLNLIQVQGWSATAAGAALLPFVAILFVLSPWAGRWADRVGPRKPLVIGPCIAGAGFAMFALPGIGGSYWSTFFPAVCVLGLGMAITIAPLTTTVMNSVGQERAGIASGVNNAVSRVAALLAIAVFGIVMSAAFDASLERELAARKLPKETVQAVMAQSHRLAAMEVPAGASAVEKKEVQQAVALAFIAGFRHVMLWSGALGVMAAVAAWVLVGRSRRKDGP